MAHLSVPTSLQPRRKQRLAAHPIPWCGRISTHIFTTLVDTEIMGPRKMVRICARATRWPRASALQRMRSIIEPQFAHGSKDKFFRRRGTIRAIPGRQAERHCYISGHAQSPLSVESECGAGGFRPNISVAAPFVWRCLTGSPVAPVSTPRSSNRTCRSPASGSRTRSHAFTHDGPRPSWVRRTSRKCPYRCESG